MPKKGCCVACHKLVAMPDDFDPKDKHKDCVCSQKCAEKERNFRLFFSDEQIGLRNFDEHGVNPNNRGKR